jgi:hypothetical protein
MATHWMWARDLLSVLVALLYGQDSDGMDLFFTSSTRKQGNYTEPRQFFDAMTKMTPEDVTQSHLSDGKPATGETSGSARRKLSVDAGSDADPSLPLSTTAYADPNDISKSLNAILEMWTTRYKRKLTILILTDGVWSSIKSRHTVADWIGIYLQKKMDDERFKDKVEKRYLSIQFIQFGDDARTAREMALMDRRMSNRGQPLP